MEVLVAWFAILIGVLMFLYVSHLCWLGIVWLFKAVFQSPAPPANESKPAPGKPSLLEDLQAAERLHQYARFQGWLDEEQNKYLTDSLTNLRNRVGLSRRDRHAEAPHSTQPIISPTEVGPSRPDRPAEAPHSTQPIVSPTEVGLSRRDRPAEAHHSTQPIVSPTEVGPSRQDKPAEAPPPVQPIILPTPISPHISSPHRSVGAMGGGGREAVVTAHALDQEIELDGKESGRGRPLHNVLRSFMERSNIRWVELISASLVVVCSVGLVISLWSTLSRTSRFFPSLVFMVATLAVHGAGQYTLGRWKLRTTSRGILHIGLMLIPLSVLVGILLAHRQGIQAAFEMNAASAVALAVGLLVYGTLAVTATRALFARNFFPIATANILASAALVPIDLITHDSASITLAAGTLLLVVLVSMLVSLWLSHQAARRLRWTGAFARRHAGMAVQVLFVTLTACVFWYLKFKPGWHIDAEVAWQGASNWWWLGVGCMGIAWSAWGWSISWPHSANVNVANSIGPYKTLRIGAGQRSVDSDASWFIVTGWFLAVIGSMVVAAGIWQANESRSLMVAMLSIGGLWWMFHGAWVRSAISQLGGCLSAILAGVICSESMHIGWQEPLAAIEWLGQERMAWLTALSATTGILSAAYLSSVRAFAARGDNLDRESPESRVERIDQFILKHLAMAACGLMVAAAGLTVLASCLPIGPTPFGGQWSARYLAFYGLALSAIAIWLERFDGAARSSMIARLCTPILLPVGLAVSILAVVRIMQASDLVPEWIVALRPDRAWSVGLTWLATAWALLAVLLKQLGWRDALVSQSNRSAILAIDWLNLAAILLAAVGMLGVVRLSDHLSLAAGLYWQLPILCISIWWSWRSSHARELATLTAALWSVIALFSYGASRDWWVELPIMVSTCAHIALACSVVLAITLCINYFKDRRPIGEASTRTWLLATPYWSSAWIVIACLFVLLIELGLPAVNHLAISLGLAQSGLEINAPGLPFAFALPSTGQAMGIVGTIILWSILALVGSRLPQQSWQQVCLGFAPLLMALALAASVPAQHALVVYLATLAIGLLLSEFVSLTSKHGNERSEATWNLLTSWQRDGQPVASSLLLGRAINTGCLLGLTALTIFLGWDGRLPEELLPARDELALEADNWTVLTTLLSWMWPAGSFLLVRWLLGTVRDIGPRRLSITGFALATLIACAASLVASYQWYAPLSGTIAWLQWIVIALSIMAGAGPCVVLLRNMFVTSHTRSVGEVESSPQGEIREGAVRITDNSASVTLPPPAASAERLAATSPKQSFGEVTSGERWERAVNCSHQLLRVGLGMMLLLCTIATASNSYVPVAILPSIRFLASWPTMVAYVSLALVVTCLWRAHLQRGQATRLELIGSYFGLVALLLGMLSPLATVFYTDWLESVPARYAVEARRFEPYRAQLVLWLVGLAFGLVMRWSMRSLHSPCDLNVQSPRAIAFTNQRSAEVLWLAVAGLVGVFAFVSSGTDPQPHWPAFELGALSLLAVLSGCFAGQAWRGHIAAMLAGAACLAWYGLSNIGLDGIWQVLLGPIVIGAISLAWQIYQQRSARSRDGEATTSELTHWTSRFKTVDQTASQHVPIVICLGSCLWVLMADVVVAPFDWTMVAVASVSAWLLAISRAWDARRGGRGLAIYFAFIAVALSMSVLVGYFNDLPFKTRGLLWMASGLGALAAVAGVLREWLRESPRIIPALRLGNLQALRAQFDAARRWLVPLHSCIGIVLLVPCLLLALQLDERGLRLANASLPFLSGLAILPIALDAGQRTARSIGLWLCSLTLLLFFSADLSPLGFDSSIADTWIYAHHTMVGLVLLGWVQWALTHWLHGKLDWPAQLARASWISFFGATTVGCCMLVGAGVDAWPRAPQLAELSTQIVWLLAWAGLIGRAAQFALRPIGVDSSASLGQRQTAVYAVEVGLALLAFSIYLCFPDLFRGLVADWWPLIVYGIAMTSAAVGHWAARSNHLVIADPVRRSSLFLPLVPLIGVWMPVSRSTNVDWSDWQRYSLVLLCGAAMYAMHGWMKPSVKLRAIAGALGLCSFWALLHSHPTLRFFEHPQFWIVPPALATLVFVEWNRQRLDEGVVTAARYAAILLAYLSSTSEIVLKAFEGQMWQPLLLLLLAVAGVLTGIALRVRAFLFCGATFVAVALVGMVWHAQQAIDQVWPWWAFGILTGVSLIAMLGYFEKNRPGVLAYLERIKSWQ